MRHIVRSVLAFPIIVYQKLVSPLLPSACRYYPSCSHYAHQAILRHGLAKGVFLGSARILRCSPLFAGGNDQVPHARRWRQLWAWNLRMYRRFWNPV